MFNESRFPYIELFSNYTTSLPSRKCTNLSPLGINPIPSSLSPLTSSSLEPIPQRLNHLSHMNFLIIQIIPQLLHKPPLISTSLCPSPQMSPL